MTFWFLSASSWALVRAMLLRGGGAGVLLCLAMLGLALFAASWSCTQAGMVSKLGSPRVGQGLEAGTLRRFPTSRMNYAQRQAPWAC